MKLSDMKKITFLVVLMSMAACTPIGKFSITNIHDLAAFQENSFIYALPRTRISIKVVAVSHYTIPGPYNAYAEKLLGIRGAASMSATQWELREISMKTFEEPDPDQYYSFQTDNASKSIVHLMQLSESGIIMDQSRVKPFYWESKLIEEKPELIHFKDLTVKRNITEDIGERKKETTNVPVDLPVTKTKKSVKTVEEKAQEAANFIIKIRKRRFKLLAGQYDVFPEGRALETSVRELDALEKEYMSLFIGKVYTDTIQRIFYYTPKAAEMLERNVFCRFSDETGIQDAMSLSGKPLVLELKNLEYVTAIKDLQNPYMGPTFENIIYYRIPEKVQLRVFFGSTNLIESEIDVLQYGLLVPLNPELIQQID